MTAGMLLNGWLVATFGPRNIFIALNFFLLRAFLGNMCRVLRLPFWQGLRRLCAGIIQPLALSTVYLAYPPAQRGVAMGWFGLGIVLALQ